MTPNLRMNCISRVRDVAWIKEVSRDTEASVADAGQTVSEE